MHTSQAEVKTVSQRKVMSYTSITTQSSITLIQEGSKGAGEQDITMVQGMAMMRRLPLPLILKEMST